MREFGALEIIFDAIIARAPRSDWENPDGGIILVATIITIVERFGEFGGAVFIEQKLIKVDGGEAGVLEFGERSFGIAEIIIQSGGIEKLDVIIVDEVEQSLFGVAGGVKSSVGSESDTDATSSKDEN